MLLLKDGKTVKLLRKEQYFMKKSQYAVEQIAFAL